MVRKTTTKGVRKPKKKTELTNDTVDKNTAINNKKETSVTEQAEEQLEKFRHSQEKSRSWMWLGVISLSIIILFFWGWSLVTHISLFNWGKTKENAMVKKTQNDWNKIFTETTKKEIEKKDIKNKLREMVEEFKEQSSTTTQSIPTSASSTTVFSTTTTSTQN